jgi:hypothetical protein
LLFVVEEFEPRDSALGLGSPAFDFEPVLEPELEEAGAEEK